MIRSLTKVLSMCFLIVITTSINAETIELSSASGNTIAAEYLTGIDNSNPVIVLHGFLQTKDFSTVSRLAGSLNDSGYTVLSPTLSLGLNNRKQSLSCEAIHTHSMDSDVAEIAQWVSWLYEKSGKQVILIGHSAGGPVLLKYMDVNDAALVKHTILISLSHSDPGVKSGETSELADKALSTIKEGANSLDDYALNYCKTYPTSAKNFLSYYTWNKNKISSVIGRYNNKVSIILGTGDSRIDDSWRRQLQDQKNHVVLIKGANHFFDQEHEFDLLDSVEELISENIES